MYSLTPKNMMKLTIQSAVMMTEAQMVIGMRMMGMMGMWRVLPSENQRMVDEKIHASIKGATDAGRAMMAGRPLADVAQAALGPVGKATKSNVNRLAKRGPGKPA